MLELLAVTLQSLYLFFKLRFFFSEFLHGTDELGEVSTVTGHYQRHRSPFVFGNGISEVCRTVFNQALQVLQLFGKESIEISDLLSEAPPSLFEGVQVTIQSCCLSDPPILGKHLFEQGVHLLLLRFDLEILCLGLLHFLHRLGFLLQSLEATLSKILHLLYITSERIL